jgi:light-regulated signal transduction histidine kinase (bacteriophytochrome)
MHTISLVEEITYRREAEEALAAQAAELARSNADLQQFAWVTSHDLREPIRGLVAFSQLLLGRYRGQFDEEADRALEFIVASAKRMDLLVRDLLAYSHVVNNESRTPSRVSLSAALDWAIANLHVSLNDSHCVIERGALPVVLADEVQLVQVLQNLLANAIKYRGAEPPFILVSAVKREQEVTVSVKDNGIGIEPRYHERIFGLFKRLHGSDIQGTGLGLAICRKIVERHGGRIWVESQPGQGANFLFTLPAAS